MPLPLILAGAAIIAGGYGVKKGLDAKSDFDTAERWNKKAQKIFDEAQADLESARKQAQSSMEALGTLKFDIYENSYLPFMDCFNKIKHFNGQKSLLTASKLPKISQAEMKEIALEMKEVVGGGVAILGSGGLAGLAAYGSVGVLGTASTGTAIGSLSGVAATNATLAWLGGGSLATGGFGMAGGTMVLGGIVAGPVLAVGGMMLASKAEAAKHDAYANHDTAKLRAEEMKNATVVTIGIQLRFDEINAVLDTLNQRFQPLLLSVYDLVNDGIDYRKYSRVDQEGLHMTFSVAETLINIMNAPLIDPDGNLIDNSIIESGEQTQKDIASWYKPSTLTTIFKFLLPKNHFK